MSLKGRVDALEQATAPRAPGDCICKWGQGSGPRVVWALEDGDQCDDPEPLCAVCGGRRPVLRVVWDHGEPIGTTAMEQDNAGLEGGYGE